MEVAIGKTWLNRIGALILLLGVGFFVKYSFDQGWISPTLRIIIGFGCGFALVVAGEYFLYREMNNFAVGLLGAGTAVLYFASFAGHYFYHLYSTNAAFGALSGVTMLSTVLAVQGNMQAIAILSLIGGFWTPYALSTGQNQQLALSVYLLLLDAGLLISGVIRRWNVLRVLAWAGTAIMYVGWYQEYYTAASLYPTLGFIAVYYLLFFSEQQISARRANVDGLRVITWMTSISNAVFFGAVYYIAKEQLHSWMGAFAVMLAALQLLSARFLRPFTRENEVLREALLISGLAILAFAAPLQFDHYWVPAAWGAQAVISLWFCRGHTRPWLRLKAVAILIVALLHVIVFDQFDATLTKDFVQAGYWHLNWLIVLAGGLALAAYLGAVCLSVGRDVPSSDRQLIAGLVVYGSLVLMGTSCAQYERYMATWHWLGLAAAWYLIARRFPRTSAVSVFLIIAIFGKFILYDTIAAVTDNDWERLHGIVLNRMFLTGVLVSVMAGVASPLVRRMLDDLGPASSLYRFLNGESFAGVLVVACLIAIGWTATFELVRMFRFEPTWRSYFTNPSQAESVFVTGLWAIYGLILWSIYQLRNRTVASFAFILTGLVLVKFVIVDTGFEATSGDWKHFRGICSNRAFIVGVLTIALTSVCYGLVRQAVLRRRAPWDKPLFQLQWLIALVLLIDWLPTFEIMRSFKFEPIRGGFRDPDLAMHVALSIAWGLMAIIQLSIGFARLVSVLRYMAIGLFGLTIAKVFLVDLAHLEMVYRIISFIGLGLLLLGASLLYQKLSPRILNRAGEGGQPAVGTL
jgi:uncharacterized membrane protein